MIPLRSSIRIRSTPVITILLIVANALVFFYQLTLGPYSLHVFLFKYGVIPDRLHLSALFTSMFLHGGWWHILANMWFLWVFGRDIEDLVGSGRYLLLYLVCGVIAGLIQVAASPFSRIPTIGASGAIAGVMGAYLMKYPRVRIATLVPFIVFFFTVDIPAAFLLLYWFVLQFFNGIGSIAEASYSGGVAWFAHVGGFLAGVFIVRIFPTRPRYSYWDME